MKQLKWTKENKAARRETGSMWWAFKQKAKDDRDENWAKDLAKNTE